MIFEIQKGMIVMKKRILALTLLASMVLTFAACGEEATDTTAAKNNSSTPTSSQAPAASSNNGESSNTPSASESEPEVTEPNTPGESTPTPGDSDPMFSDDEVEMFIVKGHAEIDGEKDEAWNNAQTVTLELIKKDNPSPDTIVKASAMWDEEGIYFLFEITDSQIFNGGAVGDYNNDGIYLYIAEDVELYAPDAASYGYGAYQFALISKELEMLPRRPEGGADIDAKTAYNRTSDGMIIEFSYKFTDYELAANRFIALDFQYNDCDESSARLGAYSWYNSTDGDFNTLNLAIAKLVEKLPD